MAPSQPFLVSVCASLLPYHSLTNHKRITKRRVFPGCAEDIQGLGDNPEEGSARLGLKGQFKADCLRKFPGGSEESLLLL